MKNKVKKAAIALAVFSAMGSGTGAFAALAEKSFTTDKNNIESEVAYEVTKIHTATGQSHVAAAQTYMGKKQSTDGVFYVHAPQISMIAERTTPYLGSENVPVSQVSGFYSYASSQAANHTHRMSIGDENTESVDISAKGYGIASGIFLEGEAGKNGAQVEVNGKTIAISAQSNDEWAHGVYVGNNTTTESVKDKVSLVINGCKASDEGTVITAESGVKGQAIGIAAYSQGKVEINGNVSIKAETAINTRGNASVVINKDKDATVQIDGDIAFDFDKSTSNTAVDANVLINLTGENSYWKGNTILTWTGTPDDSSKLSVNSMTLSLSKGAVWTPTAVEEKGGTVAKVTTMTAAVAEEEPQQPTGQKYISLNKLDMNGGVVNVENNNVQVTVDEMSGTGVGTVNLAVDLAADEKNTTGTFNVNKAANGAALNVNLMNKDMTQKLTADDIDPEQAKAALKNVGTNDNGESIVDTTTEVDEGMVNAGFGIDATGNATEGSVNTLMQSTLELASATPLAVNRILMNDVRKRLGDIRTDANTHGAWARYDGGRLSGSNGLENDFNTIQVGVDTKPEGYNTRFGVAFSYTNGDTDYARGSADMDAYSLAAYGTWMGEQGGFFDVIGRLAKINSEMVVDGSKDGSVDNLAASISAEAGWRFDVTDMVYLEPQVEMSYTYVDAESLKLGTAQYDVESVDSLIGRVGFAAGLQCPNNFGNVYVRASAVHEFLGDSKISGVNGQANGVYEIDGKDTWFEYGLGANFNISTNTYMWADVERTSGGVIDENWRATVGVRYSW